MTEFAKNQVPMLKIAGLYTNFNELSTAPEGALLKAKNIEILSDSLAEPRRGFQYLSSGFSDVSYRAGATWFYQDIEFAHYGTFGAESNIAYYSAGVWTALSGTYIAPANFKLHYLLAQKNLYFTTNAGVYKLDAYTNTPKLAGAYKALDLTASLTGSSGFLTLGNRVVYRLLWGYVDANNKTIIGAPSQREDISNPTSGGISPSCNTSLTATIPSGVTTSWFYQVYRSSQFASAVEPNDELQLIYQAFPSNTDISNGYITFTDNVIDALRGATLYTSPSQEGLAYQNERPPLATCIESFRGVTFYGNITSKNRFYLTVISAGSPNGVQLNDTLGIGGITYTAKYVETVSSGQFRAYLSGTVTFADGNVNTSTDVITATNTMQNGDPVLLTTTGTLPAGLALATTYYIVSVSGSTFKLSATKGGAAVDITAASGGGTHTATYGGSVSQNIRDTALSLVRTINQYSSSTVYAYYLSGSGDLPGQILLEERSIGGNAFAIVSSRATCWSPANIPTSGTSVSSINDNFPNGLMWSKQDQSEHVPLVNANNAIGYESSPIRALKASKEALFILKDDGVYRLTGYYPNYIIELFDSSSQILGAETCVILNNEIYCLTTQGVTVLSDSSKIISFPVEDTLRTLISANLTLVKNIGFSVSYESDRKFYLFLPSSSGDTYPTQAYVYNTVTKAWVIHELNATCGIVKDNRLYLGDAISNYVLQDRKTYTNLDYIDPGYNTTISSISTDDIVLTSGVDTISIGDVLYQSTSIFSIITAVNSVTSTVTVYSNPGFTVADAQVLKAISTEIEWLPVTSKQPGIQKQYHTIQMMLKQDFIGDAQIYFKSDLQTVELPVTIVGGAIANWGLANWGEFAWGGEQVRRNRRQWIPRPMQRASELLCRFVHSYGYSYWQLQGIVINGSMGSERSTRS